MKKKIDVLFVPLSHTNGSRLFLGMFHGTKGTKRGPPGTSQEHLKSIAPQGRNKEHKSMTATPPFTGNKSQLTLAGQLFNSPTALSNHVKQLLWSQPLCTPFTAQDDALLREWVTYHADAALKTGTGVQHFYVDQHRDYGAASRAIYIQRTDGTVVDISYKEPSRALVQLHKTGTLQRPQRDKITDFKNALRIAVDPQCLAVKQRVFSSVETLICPVTGQPFTFAEADTDHIYPMTFDALAWHWSLIWNVNPQDVELLDCGTYFRIADPNLAGSFAGYHLQTANLRVISRQANNAAQRFPTNWSLT